MINVTKCCGDKGVCYCISNYELDSFKTELENIKK